MRLPIRVTKKRLLVAGVALSLATSVLGGGVGGRLRGLVQPILAPLGDAGMYLTVAMRKNLATNADGGPSVEEFAKLRDRSDDLMGYAVYWKQQYEVTKAQLDELIGFQQRYAPASGLPCELIPARVVGASALPYSEGVSLNAGQGDGAAAGELVLVHDRAKALPSDLAVVTASALAGRISDAGAFSARLQLITDRDFKTSARIRRIPDAGNPREISVTTEGKAALEFLSAANNRPIDVQAIGDGAGGLTVADVWREDNVLPGDLLVTSAGSGLPIEVRIGVVSAVRPDRDNPRRAIISVRPEADLDALRDVLIVVPSLRATGGR